MRKRSLTIAGHRTSVSLEEPFWSALKEAADREGTSLAVLAARIDSTRGRTGLSSAIRTHLFALARRGLLPSAEPDEPSPP